MLTHPQMEVFSDEKTEVGVVCFSGVIKTGSFYSIEEN